MRRLFVSLALVVLAVALAAQTQVVDLRVGSFRGDELLPPGRSGADHTRLIIELDAAPQHSVSVEGNGLVLVISDVVCCEGDRSFPVDNGLVSRVDMRQTGDDAVFHIVFDGRYESHEARTFDNPPRVVLDVRGAPAEALRQPPLIRSSTADGPVIERVGGQHAAVRKLDMDELRELFPADAPLYLDLYEVPIANVLRWFSQHSTYDIIAGTGVEGDVSLTLQNQTLAEAFALLLRSNNLVYMRNGAALTVVPAAQTAMDGERKRHTVWVRHIDCHDMKSILAAHLSDDALLVQDSRSGRLDMLVPASAVGMVDSLVAAYDTPPPAYSFAVTPVLLPQEIADGLPWRSDGLMVLGAEEWRTLAPSVLGKGESRTLTANVQQETTLDGVYVKSFKAGWLLSSSHVALPSGFELRLTPRVAPGRPSELSFAVNWRCVTRDLTSSSHATQGETPIRAEEVLLLRDTLAADAIDNWSAPATSWVGAKRGTPALLVVPRIDHISLD